MIQGPQAPHILQGLIEYYQNDFMGGYYEDDKEQLRILLLEIIVEVTRYTNNFRYCSREECSCSPESGVYRLVNSNREQVAKLFQPYILTDTLSSETVMRFLNSFSGEVQ